MGYSACPQTVAKPPSLKLQDDDTTEVKVLCSTAPNQNALNSQISALKAENVIGNAPTPNSGVRAPLRRAHPPPL